MIAKACKTHRGYTYNACNTWGAVVAWSWFILTIGFEIGLSILIGYGFYCKRCIVRVMTINCLTPGTPYLLSLVDHGSMDIAEV